jgi:hypothetical protein
MRVIKVTEIRRVDGCAREERRWKRRQSLSRIFEQRRCGSTVKTDEVGTETGGFDDLIRAAFAVGEFRYGSSRGVAVDLDFSHDKVADCKGDRRSGGVGAFTMNSTAFLGEQTKDLFCELGRRASETEEGMNIRSLLLSRSRGRSQAQVEGKSERATDSWNTPNNISAVDRAAVPGVSSGMSGFDEDGVGAAIIGGDGNGFVKEPMKVFDADGFVVAASSDMEIDSKDGADFFEKAFEGAAVVDDDQTAETDLEKDILDKQASKIVRRDIIGSSDKYEPCEVTHGVHKIRLAAIIGDLARGPKVDMKDIEGAA